MTNDSSLIGRSGSYSKGVARRQEILDRAIEVFAARGADGTSLRRIAEAIGVSHAALLHYFDSREQLLVAVYAHAEQERSRARPAAHRGAGEGLVQSATENVSVPGLVQLYTTLVAMALEEGSGASREFIEPRFAKLRVDLATHIRQDQAAGLVRSDVDADAVAALLIAASDGLQTQWLLEPSIPLSETLRVFEVLLTAP
ncbi:MAG: TetR/AcrR family transcriptional regulator [Rhodoglobus sp.]